MTDQKEIDKKRDAALWMEVGDKSDQSQRVPMTVADKLYMISAKAIYQISLADQIDPDRKNIHIPNAQKQVLKHGYDNPVIGQVLFTAKTFFDKKFLVKDFDCDFALNKAFEATKILTEMQDIHASLRKEIEEIQKQKINIGKDGSVKIPTTHDLETKIVSYFKKTDQLWNIVIDLLKQAYSPEKGKDVFEKIKLQVVSRHGANSPLTGHIDFMKPTLNFLRNCRNAIEHPKVDDRLVISDFALSPDNIIDVPTIELIHPDTPQQRVSTIHFMKETIDWYAHSLEALIVGLCYSNISQSSGFQYGVVELPEDRRRVDRPRFSYGVFLQGNWQPLG